jgi:hypothetical protein
MASLAFTAEIALANTVEVGLVLGVKAATTPIGQAISYNRFSGSCLITPTVFTSQMLSQRMREASSFFNFL